MIIDIIDPHIHLFDLTLGEYHWLNTLSVNDREKIAKTFTLADLKLSGNLCLAGFVHIEAGFNNHHPDLEIAHIEEQVRQRNNNNLNCKTSGSANLTLKPSAFKQEIDAQTRYLSCVGVRHILNEDVLDILANRNTLENLKNLAQRRILFELQMPLEDQEALTKLIATLKLVPDLQVVLNHSGFPPLLQIKTARQEQPVLNSAVKHWTDAIQRLSKLPNVSVKCSGWEMTSRDFDQPSMVFVVKHLVTCFTEQRVMFASNFPLVLYGHSYQEYWQMMLSVAKACDLDIRTVCFSNAKRIYQFSE